MPFPHQRRRGATILFRRKIPSDLRDRFGCGEIVRSLGRATPGEARRMTHHLWSQTEMAFMFIRRETGLTGEAIAQVVNSCLTDFRDQIDLAIADVRPGIAKDWCDETAQVSAKLSGATALLDQTLSRGEMSGMAEASRSGAQAVLGKTLVPDSLDERRLGRSLMQALRNEMEDASRAFAELSQHRPDDGASPLRQADEYDVSAADLEALRAARVGENVAHILARLSPALDGHAGAPATPRPETSAASPHLRNAGKPVSALWQSFCDSKVTMKEWKPNESISSKTTLRLWIQLRGDLPPRMYTTEDASLFHQALSMLPAKYYHNKEFRQIYEEEGVDRLIKVTESTIIDRISAKTWNSHNSTLNEFFKWCAEKGSALPAGTRSICSGEFVKIPKKRKKNRGADAARGCYQQGDRTKLFSAPKYRGCVSKRNWKDVGQLVFRDHRYWMPLIAASHGCRREEPAILRVKHVRKTPSDIWFFNWDNDEIVPLLKDVGSPRDVPLHQDLLALGFLEARVIGRDPEAMLFPEAVSHGQMARHAGPFGQWYGHFCNACGVTDPALDFHAWRHAVVTGLLDAGVPPAHIEAIVGHESGRRHSVLGDYDHGRKMDTLKEGIDKLVVGIDVVALMAAVARSYEVDPSAAWPDLTCSAIVPKAKQRIAR